MTEVRSEDKSELAKLVTAVKEGYNEKYEEHRRHWGGGIMGAKATARTRMLAILLRLFHLLITTLFTVKKQKALDAAIKI
jgi:hypothetical protein